MSEIKVTYSPDIMRYHISGHISDLDLAAVLNPQLMVRQISEEVMASVCAGATEKLRPHLEAAVQKTLLQLGPNIDEAIKKAFAATV